MRLYCISYFYQMCFVRFYPLFELCHDLFYYINNLSAQAMFIHFGRDDMFNIMMYL